MAPAAAESKTICFPSGDQRGVPVTKDPLKAVTWKQCVPSLAQVQISLVPDRLDAKAMRLPSGEYSALPSTAEEEVSRTGAGIPRLASATSSLQIFPFAITWE